MNRVDKRRLSEEEADAEIERVQQKITLALQQIDENFATCNQIVTSRIGPGIDQYGEASQQVWDFSKVHRHSHYYALRRVFNISSIDLALFL